MKKIICSGSIDLYIKIQYLLLNYEFKLVYIIISGKKKLALSL